MSATVGRGGNGIGQTQDREGVSREGAYLSLRSCLLMNIQLRSHFDYMIINDCGAGTVCDLFAGGNDMRSGH